MRRGPRSTPELITYQWLRTTVGVLGVALPFVLMAWGWLMDPPRTLPSISEYYALRTRDVLVGTLFAIASFLFAYRGYDWLDEAVGKVASVAALGVALFPVTGARPVRIVHFSCAGVLFGCLAFFSLALFTKTDQERPTPRKIARNAVYIVCGVAIALCMAAIGLLEWWMPADSLQQSKAVLVCETVALVAFGTAWFVKGEPLPFLRDRPSPG